MKIKVGVIGCGTIGRCLIEFIDKDLSHKATVVAIFDKDQNKAKEICRSLKKNMAESLAGLVKKSDLIIEAASIQAADNLLKQLVHCNKDALIMSIGAALGNEKLLDNLKRKGVNVYFPSGAICGIDGLKAVALDKIHKVELLTRKPVEGFSGAPYVQKNKINLDAIKTEKVIFSGNAKEAIKAFPQNINVAAILSIAGIGANRTKVKIIASKKIKRNIHEIIIEAKAANIRIRAENVPSPNNPKTSYLAVLSAQSLLNRILNKVNLGS